MEKLPLHWNQQHNLLRLAQGIPAEVPVMPTGDEPAESVLRFNTNTIFHVAAPAGSGEALHIFVSSNVACTIYVRILPASEQAFDGEKNRLRNWPSTSDAITVKIRHGQPGPVPVLQGHTIRNGACLSLMATSPGARAFGFVVASAS
jgi:hypothetical protein